MMPKTRKASRKDVARIAGRLALLLVLLGFASVCNGINERWRLKNVLKSRYSSGYGYSETFTSYQYCYHPGTDYTLDSLSIRRWSVIDDVPQPEQYLAPFVADFGVVEDDTSYTVRTAWVDGNYGSTPKIREYKRTTAGVWLEDKLFDAAGNILWHKVYDYNYNGSVKSIRLTDYEPGQVSQWLTEITYDVNGKKINQYKYLLENNVWAPKQRNLYQYLAGAGVPAQIWINGYIPYMCHKWNEASVEVFSGAELDKIYMSGFSNGAWHTAYEYRYQDYVYSNEGNLTVYRREFYGDYPSDDYSYGATFNSEGMRTAESEIAMYADASVLWSAGYDWEFMGDTQVPDEVQDAIAVFPNPFQSEISIEASKDAVITGLAVYNLRGQLVRNISIPPNPSAGGAFKWDGTDQRGIPVAPGLYLVRANTDQGIVLKKAFKVNKGD